LKLGTTSLILAALEDGALPDPLDLADPVESCWRVSHDLTLQRPLQLDGGGQATAVELQWRYHEWVKKYVEAELPDDAIARQVVDAWEMILTDLETDPTRTADRLDWAAKHRILQGYVERDGLSWDDHKLKALDLQYHDVDPTRSLYQHLAAKGQMRRLFTDHDIETAETTPPERTRAYFRGTCVSKFPGSLVAANWDSLVFDVGEAHLKRVPMMEPLRGDRLRVGDLLDSVDDAAGLIIALGGH
jgi:proteasome accessory factor A